MDANEENPQTALILVRMQQPSQAGQILEHMQDRGLQAAALVERDDSGVLAYSSPDIQLDSETLLLSEAFQGQLDLNIPSEDLPPGEPGLLLLIDGFEAANSSSLLAELVSNIQHLTWSEAQQEALKNLAEFPSAAEPEEMAADELAGDEDFPGYS
jgi:hypothetical protein